MVDAIIDQTHSEPTQAGNKFSIGSLSRMSIATVNRGLMVVALVAVLYFAVTLLGGVFKLMTVGMHIRQLESKGAQMTKSEPEPTITLSEPVDPALSNRNIFQPAGSAVSSTSDASSGPSGASAYRLVGISMSNEPAETYVMVENSQTKLTYFLQYGQLVEGLELERILEDKVIVKIGGKAVEFE